MNAFKEHKLNYIKIANEIVDEISRPKSASLKRTPTKQCYIAYIYV